MPLGQLRPDVRMPRWLSETGDDSDVVVSTRCRLARNLEDFPFPWKATERQRRETANALLEAVDSSPIFDRAAKIGRDGLHQSEIRKLMELRLVSSHWWEEGTARWLVAAQSGIVSLLVNEEDHLRIQAILPGLQVESSLIEAQNAERQLGGRLLYARREDVGFLTASLTNAGTGLRLSAMLHLPALAASDKLDTVLSAAEELGCAVRGAFGEGSAATGAFYQVSNSRACFVETYRIVDRVRASARYLVDAEREARNAQFSDEAGKQSLLETTADVLRLLFQEEAGQSRLLSLTSLLRLAAAEGILPLPLEECAAWITIAGASPAPVSDRSTEAFQAIQRTAAIRQRVRQALGMDGTFHFGRAE